jgi:hypothetical protein
VNDLRAKLGNDLALKASREGKLPFPDGAIIARLAWRKTTLDENKPFAALLSEEASRPNK